MSDDLVTIDDATVKRETDAAILVDADGVNFWVPKSQIDATSEVWSLKNPGPGTLVVPRWLAEEKGFST